MSHKESYPFSLHIYPEHCHGTQEKPEAKATQNKHKPKTNTLSPQILPVYKNNLQTKIMGFASQWTGSAEIFFL